MNNTSRITKNLQKSALITGKTLSWLCGFHGDGTALVAKNKLHLFTDGRFIEEAEATGAVVFIGSKPEQDEALKRTVQEMELARVGICSADFTYARGIELQSMFSLFETDFTAERALKQEWEIEKIGECAKITEDCFESILEMIKPGITEADVAAHIMYYFAKRGAKPSFDPIVASGSNGSKPHAGVTLKKLMSGELVTMDFGCEKDGYCSDFTRTIALSGLEHSKKVVYNVCKSACEGALDALTAGKSTAEVDKVARDIISEAGYGECFLHGLGHGVGCEVHEAPRLSYTSGETLLEGMVVTVEPGIYMKGEFGMRIEDMALVTPLGHRNFYKATKELIIVD